MPILAVSVFGGVFGWRYAVACSGLLAMVYSVIFYRGVRDTPKGATYFKAKKTGGLEVTSKGDLTFYLLMNVPIYLTLALIAWRLSPAGLNIISATFAMACYGVVMMLALWQLLKIWQVNQTVLQREIPRDQRYHFRQVAVLSLAYMACFGSEVAVTSMLPLLFSDLFHLKPQFLGLMAGSFTIMNVVARPGGGLLADQHGRRRVLMICLLAQTVGYAVLSNVSAGWGLGLAVGMTLLTSVFVQGACGAVYSMVPLIQRRMTGQIAGMAGAYGNIGGALFLIVLSFVNPHLFFLCIAATTLLAFIGAQFLDEPHGHMVEVADDGSVQLIAVD